MPDRRGPLGNLGSATRRVRPEGRLLFAGHWYRHEQLLNFVGSDVRVTATDIWVSQTVDVNDLNGNFICQAELVTETESQ